MTKAMDTWDQRPLQNTDSEKIPGLLALEADRVKELVHEYHRVRYQELSALSAFLSVTTAITGLFFLLYATKWAWCCDQSKGSVILLEALGVGAGGFALYVLPKSLARFIWGRRQSILLRRNLGEAGQKLEQLIRMSSQLAEHHNYDLRDSVDLDFVLLGAESVLRQVYDSLFRRGKVGFARSDYPGRPSTASPQRHIS